ncbi:pectinesterase-like [Chenopodium quinoa]|uniref:pectinesterase-like n=1 Tax=Chenopodium quinoa TaxID=63459 RepID=UPI000B76DFA2|nr:pectinesterase-like [Chenopodium quinoa]
MKGKLIGLGISIIIIVGVAVGLVYFVRRTHIANEHKPDPLSSTSKAVQAICSPTDYKEACVQSLASVAKNQSASLQDYIHIAIMATMDAVKQGFDNSESIGKEANDPLNKMAFEDCKELLRLATDELQSVLLDVSDVNMSTMKNKEDDLKNWLSATVAYQQSCLDGVDNPDLKEKMTKGLDNASQLTSNMLAIVSEISPILSHFGININVTNYSRRLLNTNENLPKVDKDGFPTWVSSEDRKLLGRINTNNPKPNVIVARDGSGQFKTINDALKAYPKNLQGRYVIYVKAGIYDEQVLITKDQINVYMYGDGPRKTIVTGKKSFRDGVSTYKTATFAVIGNGFIGKSMGFQNTAGAEGHQAVALRVQSDMSAFYNCRMDGYQDTLYPQAHRQFYRNCVISGTVDFIFGDGSAIIQNSLIVVRKPMDNQQNTITAQGKKDRREITGIVIHNCRIVPEQKLFADRFKIPTFLGRPWKEYSTTLIMQSMLADFIQPAGWMPWAGNFALDTLYYGEYANRGPGANTSRRVRWKGYRVITNRDEAMRFTIGPFIQGQQWLPSSTMPFLLGLKN